MYNFESKTLSKYKISGLQLYTINKFTYVQKYSNTYVNKTIYSQTCKVKTLIINITF